MKQIHIKGEFQIPTVVTTTVSQYRRVRNVTLCTLALQLSVLI